MIGDIIARYANPTRVLLVTSNAYETPQASSDIDIYCVTSGGISSVHMFHGVDGRWVELFIDTISDLRAKLENGDEIAANFIRELPLVSGDRALHEVLLAEATNLADRYALPGYRKNMLRYRVKVLWSKYDAVVGQHPLAQERFLLNALSYPLLQLALEHHGVFPGSPKRWLVQLRSALPSAEFDELDRFLAHDCTRDDVARLCGKYAGDLEPIHIQKRPSQNRTTFLA